jgi:hypothetical protein
MNIETSDHVNEIEIKVPILGVKDYSDLWAAVLNAVANKNIPHAQSLIFSKRFQLNRAMFSSLLDLASS